MAEKRLELVLCNQDRAVCILFLLVLLLVETNLIPKKRRDKKNLVSFPNFSGGKVVFILLTEVITLYIELSVVHIWEMSF